MFYGIVEKHCINTVVIDDDDDDDGIEGHPSTLSEGSISSLLTIFYHTMMELH